MKTMLRWLAMAALAFGPPAAAAPTYSSLYVFGDSLVDAGNANLATGGVEAPAGDGFYFGRFSNGLTFADYLSGLVTPQAATVPAFAGGRNYAVGGADAQTKAGSRSPSFGQQFTNYYLPLTKNAPIAADALVLVTFGANDVRDTVGTRGTVDLEPISAALEKTLNLLYLQGARNFLITGVPDIGMPPRSIAATGNDPAQLAELTDRSRDLSDLFKADTQALDAKAGVNAVFFDLFDFQQQLIANPASVGLPANLDTTTPCQILGGGTPQFANCARSLYFDDLHPTTVVHQAIAGAAYNRLAASVSAVPEPATWMVMIVGFSAVGVGMRRKNRVAAHA